MIAPLLGTLGACAGVIALGFGIFILPVYGGVRLYQKFDAKRQENYRFDFPPMDPAVVNRLYDPRVVHRLQETGATNQQQQPSPPQQQQPSYHHFELERL